MVEQKRFLEGNPSEQQLSAFIRGLENSIDGLRRPKKWNKYTGQRRSVVNMSEVRKQRGDQLRNTEDALAILRNNSSGLRFYQNEKGRIIGFQKPD